MMDILYSKYDAMVEAYKEAEERNDIEQMKLIMEEIQKLQCIIQTEMF